MAIPKQLKDKVSLLALKDAAKSDFSDDNAEVDEKDPEEPMEQYCCPKCQHCGSKEEFLTEGE